MALIPKSHPRTKSLLIREKLVDGFDDGIVCRVAGNLRVSHGSFSVVSGVVGHVSFTM